MRYTITKIRNGCWEYENEKGIKTQHSLQSGAEKMAMAQEHFHRPADKPTSPVYDFFTAPEEVQRPIVEEAIKKASKEQAELDQPTV